MSDVKTAFENYLKMATGVITCEEYYDKYLTDKIDEAIQDMHWNREFDAKYLFNIMITDASESKIVLQDLENFDYEDFFWNIYKSSEKGLS